MTSLTTTTAVETSFVSTTKDAGGGVDEMKQTETSANALAEVKQEKTIEMISNNNPITDIVKETNAMTAATPITTTSSTAAATITTTSSTAAATITSIAALTTAVAESEVDEATTPTPSPKQLSAVACTTTPPHTTAASKIPHLQQQHQQQLQHSPPFTPNRRWNQLLHSPDTLRRSASLRMRGSKSNLFGNYNEHYMEMERSTRHLSYVKPTNTTPSPRYSLPAGCVLGEQQRQQQQRQPQKESDTNEQHTHIHTAGSFGGVVTPTTAAAAATATATRRKATNLFGSTLSTQTPAMTVGNLTRSQSLRRSYPDYNYSSQQKSVKTDALKEQSADGASGAAGTTAATGTDVAIQENTATDNVSPLKINSSQSNGSVPNGCGKQENDIMYKSGGVGEQCRIDRDMQRMSLNLNSSGGERSTTTKLPTAAAAASPFTPTGSGNTGIRITPVNSISPKTPHKSAIPGQHYVKSSPNANPQETKVTPKTPPVTPDSPYTNLDDDLDSMYSLATTSGRSTMSNERAYVPHNGTTYSARQKNYVLHNSCYAGQVGSDYLTPTQRAERQVIRLKELLRLARQNLGKKDSDIIRLTNEVIELRLFKASLSSPEERSASSDAVTVREAELKTSQDVSPIVDMVDDATKSSPRHIPNQHHLHHTHSQHLHHTPQLASEMQSSFADSGHFEDLSVHSKDSYAAHTQDIACGSDEVIGMNEIVCDDACAAAGAQEEDYAATIKDYELQRQELIRIYEQKIEELIRTQDGASSELKRSHNDKVEALLQKLAECNTRYADIVPDYEHAKERIRELEKQLEDLQRKLAEHEDKQNKMYLHMYQKGQEAERIARADQALESVHRAPGNKVSINELLHQLQSTQDELENIRAAGCRKESGSNHALLTAKEAISLWVLGARKTIYRRLLEAQKNRTHVDPEVTLQFLKSAIYYFLTDKENSQGHLQAIESILEFTEAEKLNISKARTAK